VKHRRETEILAYRKTADVPVTDLNHVAHVDVVSVTIPSTSAMADSLSLFHDPIIEQPLSILRTSVVSISCAQIVQKDCGHATRKASM
jgi:hypothetical protein